MAMRDATEEEVAILDEIRASMKKLERLGWSNTMTPLPRDKDVLVVEAGSNGIFRGRYHGAYFFVEDGGDLWPCRPLAWMEVPDAWLCRMGRVSHDVRPS